MNYGGPMSLPASTGGACSCVSPKAPIIGQGFETIAVGDGDTPVTVIDQGSDPALEFGTLTVKGCVPVRAMVTYLDGGDCDSCTTTALTPKVVEYLIDGNSAMNFTQGLITKVEVVTIDTLAGDTPTATTSEVKVSFFGSKVGNPCCTEYLANATTEA